MNLEKIVAISGKPGLYKIISQSKNGVIVESLIDKKRLPIGSLHNVSALNDIAIYTYEEDIPLREVLFSIFQKENGEKAIDHKSGKQELLDYFNEVLPDYDEERVYASNIKKVILWYNVLLSSGFDFSSLEEKEEDTEEE